jgi:hypothetical protein
VGERWGPRRASGGESLDYGNDEGSVSVGGRKGRRRHGVHIKQVRLPSSRAISNHQSMPRDQEKDFEQLWRGVCVRLNDCAGELSGSCAVAVRRPAYRRRDADSRSSPKCCRSGTSARFRLLRLEPSGFAQGSKPTQGTKAACVAASTFTQSWQESSQDNVAEWASWRQREKRPASRATRSRCRRVRRGVCS